MYTTTTLIAAFLAITSAASAVEDQQKPLVRSGLKAGKSTTLKMRSKVMEGSFWDEHGKEFGVTKEDMRQVKAFKEAASGMSFKHYQQKLLGHDVFAGRVVLATAKDSNEVIRAHGHTLDRSLIPHDQLVENGVAKPTITAKYARQKVVAHLVANQDIEEANARAFSMNQPLNLVWHRSLASFGQTGNVKLVYHFEGTAKRADMMTDVVETESLIAAEQEDAKAFVVHFDAFVDAKTGEMINFIDRTDQIVSDTQLEALKQRKAAKATAGTSTTVSGAAARSLRRQAVKAQLNSRVDAKLGTLDTVSLKTPFPNLNVYAYDLGDKQKFNDNKRLQNKFPTTDPNFNLALAATVELDNLYTSSSGGSFVSFQGSTEASRYDEYLNRPRYANAYYDGNKIVFGEGLVLDDVLAHEWSHGLTDYTSSLIYQDESGALNEALSDMYGEAIDLLNFGQPYDATNTQSPDRQPAGYEQNMRTAYPRTCTSYNWAYGDQGSDDSYRWLMGQYAFAGIDGAIRDMYYPECFANPSDVWSNDFYCGTADYGGVHINSGIANRMFALMVDGGVIDNSENNQVSVSALGMDKALYLVNMLQINLVPSSGFEDFGNTLNDLCEMAANAGTVPFYADITRITSSASPSGAFTSADCTEVAKIVTGSGMTRPDLLCSARR